MAKKNTELVEAKGGDGRPSEETQAKLAAEMTTDCVQMAREISDILDRARTGSALALYDIGARLLAVQGDPDRFGQEGIAQIVGYTGLTRDRTMAYARMAAAYDRDDLAAALKIPQANGNMLTFRHFELLAEVRSAKDRDGLLKRTRNLSWSSRELESEIRSKYEKARGHSSGGRAPARPVNATAGLLRISSQALQLDRYLSARLRDDIVDRLPTDGADARTVESLDKALSTLAQLRQDVEEAQELLTTARRKMQGPAATEKPAGKAKAKAGAGPTETGGKERPPAARSRGGTAGRRHPQPA